MSRILKWWRSPFWLLQLATGAKSFADNPILGSSALNRLGLHVWRLKAAHAFARSRRARLAHLVPAKLRAEFDKNGFVETKGLPTCTLAKLEGTTPQQARSRCAKALVGTGTGTARVQMPGAGAVKMTSPLSFFNAPPTGGRPTIIAHAYETMNPVRQPPPDRF